MQKYKRATEYIMKKDDINVEKSEWVWGEAEAHPHVERPLDKKQYT